MAVALIKAYRTRVAWRQCISEGDAVITIVPCGGLKSIVEMLTSLPIDTIDAGLAVSKLADLFVDAQFEAMPQDWCWEKFKTNYPPVNIVFSEKSIGRYEKYSKKD